ncbi:MAG: response regulator transcription factor [Verrucomicrobiota bacterium]
MFGIGKPKRRVLIVDDNMSLASGLQKVFKKQGILSDLAHSPNGLRRSFENPEPWAIVLDIKLGDVNGLELIPEVRTKWPSVPIIMITGQGYDDTLMEEARAQGAQGYVSKLVSPMEIVAAVTRVLEHGEKYKTTRVPKIER